MRGLDNRPGFIDENPETIAIRLSADLAQVIIGAGIVEYLDPACFFANTYPTRGLKNLLANVCRRLAGAGGEVASIFRLDTSYGGTWSSDVMPPGTDVQPLGHREYGLLAPGMTERLRVATDPEYFEEHAESLKLWSPGQPPVYPPGVHNAGTIGTKLSM